MATTTSAPLGLRETKKPETRQLISDHATRLFIEQGFENTTIAELAETVAPEAARAFDLLEPALDDYAVE